METISIKSNDHYGDRCLKDSVVKNNQRSKPQGFVEIFEKDEDGNQKLVSKSNLVLYKGREWIASRLVNISNPNVTMTKEMFISWLGVGTGGAPIADPLNPISPNSADLNLLTEIPFNATSTEYADFRSAAYYKHPFDSIVFEQDVQNDNKFLILNITTTIGTDDCNGANINEAALFLSTSLAPAFAGPFSIFSKITFPTIVKSDTRQLVFVWYIYV
jgi:hypothetical protein